jgi:hypothetical protein
MRVALAVALPDHQEVVEIELLEGATVADAIAAAAAHPRLASFDLGAFRVGIWARAASPASVLREGDRVELYRELKADPKDARRARAAIKPSTRSRSGP